MFGARQFEHLYAMLAAEMVASDCGISDCGKFCCVGDGQVDNAFKYLLPGEAEYLVTHGFHNYAVLEDFGFLIHYRANRAQHCACEKMRGQRPFCCRVFPFRPVIDVAAGRVVDLVKAQNKSFTPCWISEPLANWRVAAISAWNYVLTDRSNRQFYAQYFYCLKKSETAQISFFQALEEDELFGRRIHDLNLISDAQLWQLCQQFFTYV
jgi:hypothetical protein